MTSNPIRTFAAGLLVATSIFGAVYFSGSNTNETKTTTEKISEKEMKTTLSSAGYVIHTKEEWNKQLSAVKDAEKKAAETANKDNEQKPTEPTEKDVYRMMLTVSDGMTSIEVGNALVSGHIIEISAFDFSKVVESKGVENKLQLGTYEVQSGMTTDEIIANIFK
ncbi:hypothetical protein [Bacillus sp. 1NLA3E]|uniref:hypothetical protein n=1 Tax=Bacillus sp. 1NLA3E TaxID=666686 RepID=UPI000247E97F|nr:hypothetical protein [Bacillus sp. 1NLA3E]AGK55857.1 hypothetical protein B1NLA3E_20595 [Bacillus sp. 1NLA3E]